MPAAPGEREGSDADARHFLQALDALASGVIFFELEPFRARHASEPFHRLLETGPEAFALEQDVVRFAEHLLPLVHARRLEAGPECIALLDSRPLLRGGARFMLRAGYVGLDLFGGGPTLVLTLEPRSPAPRSEASLRERFGLSGQQSRILRLVASSRATPRSPVDSS